MGVGACECVCERESVCVKERWNSVDVCEFERIAGESKGMKETKCAII